MERQLENTEFLTVTCEVYNDVGGMVVPLDKARGLSTHTGQPTVKSV